MALSPFPVNHQNFPTSSRSLYYLLLRNQTHFPNNSFRALKFKPSCSSHQAIKVGVELNRKKRKPKPSFLDEIKDKWSQKPIISTGENFPWQQKVELEEEDDEDEDEEEEEEIEREQSFGATLSESESDKDARVEASESVNFSLPSRVTSAPWSHGSKFNEPHFDFVVKTSNFESRIGERFASKKQIEFHGGNKVEVLGDQIQKPEFLDEDVNFNEQKNRFPVSKEVATVKSLKEENFEVSTSGDKGGSVGDSRIRKKRSNTEMAERVIPEHELRRLRNVALRMVERTKVGVAGIDL